MFRVSPEIALRLVTGGSYIGNGSLHRVRVLHQQQDNRKPNVHDGAYWDGRACRHYDGAPDRHTVDLWDQILRRA